MAYSEDYRKRTIQYYREGHTQAEVYDAFKALTSTVRDWETRINEGSLKPRYPKTCKPRKLPPDELSQYVKENPDNFLREIGAHFRCSAEAVRKALKKSDITLKKTVGYKERSEEAREEFKKTVKAIPVSRRIYIDESGISKQGFRTHARALRGKRLHGLMSGKRFSRVNVVAGYCSKRILGEYCYRGLNGRRRV